DDQYKNEEDSNDRRDECVDKNSKEKDHDNKNKNQNQDKNQSQDKYQNEEKNNDILNDNILNEELSEGEMIKRIMGISEFSTTYNKCHKSTDISGINKRTKRKYRQYMNRRGGFNRPLSPTF
ncbi:hypothetical protein PFMG_04918, partial [Plasmodium falciparum IGH-CR14]